MTAAEAIPTPRPAYVAKPLGEKFQVIEHHSGKKMCETDSIDDAHVIAGALNNEDSWKWATTRLKNFTMKPADYE